MTVSQVGSTTTSYYVTNGANGASASSKTVTSSSTTVSSTTTRSGSASTTSSATAVSSTTAVSGTTKASGSASTTSSTTAISSTTSYASATAKTTCSTTVTYSGSSSTAKVSSTTVATVEATSTNKVGASASTTAKSGSAALSDEESVTKIIKGFAGYLNGVLEYCVENKNAALNVSEDLISTLVDFINRAKEWVDDRNSLDESEAFANMDYDEILTYRVQNAVNPLCVDVFRKYIDEIAIADINYDDTAYYDSVLNYIFYSQDKDAVNVRGAVTTYFHEVGHCMDDVMDFNDDVSNDSDYDFIDVLRSDFNNFVSDVQEEYGLSKEEAYVWIDDWLDQDSDMKHSVSDLITGLSNYKIEGPWNHEEEYYSDSKIENEAFAHFFEAGMSYKPIKLQYIKEVFPNAYKMFEEMLVDRL